MRACHLAHRLGAVHPACAAALQGCGLPVCSPFSAATMCIPLMPRCSSAASLLPDQSDRQRAWLSPMLELCYACAEHPTSPAGVLLAKHA